jgi:hypothetical protein
MWCVACGDDVRLLPAATAAVSFTAQQHLSVVPASAVLTVGALGLLAATWRREGRWHDATSRRELRRWGAWSGLVALVLWAPVLAQQAFDDEGNLGQAVWFARHGNNETVGYSSAVWQLTHALGLPPLLGRTEVTGQWLLSRPTPFGWASAAAVVATVVALGWRWRGREPRRVALCAMAGVVAIAGLVNGSLVPASLEQYRLPFYHWTFVLALFVALVLGLAATDAVRGRPVAARPALVPVLTGLVVVAIAAPSLANPLLDRRTNTLVAAQATVERDVMDRLADDVIAHPDGLGDHPVLLARNEPLYAGISLGLAYELTERGVDLRHPAFNRFYVSDQRLADRDEIDGGIVVVVNDDAFRNAPEGGELVAEAELWDGFDHESYRALVATASDAGELRLGPAGDQAMADLPDDVRLLATGTLARIVDDPEIALQQAPVLEWVRDHPPEAPALDPAAAGRVLASLDAVDTDDRHTEVATLHVYVLDRDEVLRVAGGHEISRPGD